MRAIRAIRPTRKQVLAAGATLLLIVVVLLILGRNTDPNAIGNMPGPVQQVLDTATLSGNDIALNILTVTGNQADINSNTIPGDYSYGPVDGAGNNTYYVDLEVPVDMNGIAKRMGYAPQISQSSVSPSGPETTSTVAYDDYVDILPLPNLSFDRLYFDPRSHLATFSFKLNADGMVMDESWDAVAVNS